MLRKGKSQYGFWERWKLENFQTKSYWRLCTSQTFSHESQLHLLSHLFLNTGHIDGPDRVRFIPEGFIDGSVRAVIRIAEKTWNIQTVTAAKMILFESFLISIFPWIHIDPFPLRSISGIMKIITLVHRTKITLIHPNLREDLLIKTTGCTSLFASCHNALFVVCFRTRPRSKK